MVITHSPSIAKAPHVVVLKKSISDVTLANVWGVLVPKSSATLILELIFHDGNVEPLYSTFATPDIF